MAKCMFCEEDVQQFDKPSECYVIATEFSTGKKGTHIHVHGTLEDKNGMIALIEAIIAESGLEDMFDKTDYYQSEGETWTNKN